MNAHVLCTFISHEHALLPSLCTTTPELLYINRKVHSVWPVQIVCITVIVCTLQNMLTHKSLLHCHLTRVTPPPIKGMSKYARPNLAPTADRTVSSFFLVVAHATEVYVFLYIGASAVLHPEAWTSLTLGFVAATILALAVSRLVNVSAG